PEIITLIDILNKMGGQITITDDNSIIICGCRNLKPVDHTIIPDRIEAGTYLMAALATNGNVTLHGIGANYLAKPIKLLIKAGAKIEEHDDSITVHASTAPLAPIRMKTAPYPGFPTDLQAQLMALCATIPGISYIDETVFENRFMHVPELLRMGAAITTNGNHAVIDGKKSQLVGAPVMATDLRASVSLVIAALAAQGTSIINRIYHLDRGYDSLEQKLIQCGAKILRVPRV
ncbi:MAG: UDP-N-acetylglucosamine 1-carboxyvinyltransferase, partial [Pseudomonadota bacterium]